jgi:hypothetical protein
MRQLSIGPGYEWLGSYPMQPGDPPDADAEYEPEETIEALTLDKYGAASVVSRAGVAAPAQSGAPSASDLKTCSITWPFPLFVKPRWEGSSKGIRAPSTHCSPT